MIILGNAWLALLSPPQEIQSTREESGFGTLLTAIEQHAASLPDQEAVEHRALESVLQVLMSIFQSCTPANCLPVASAPETGESGLVSMHPIEGLPFELPPGRGIALALWETAEVDLPPGMVSDGTQDIGQLTFPALDGQSTGPSPATTGAPENFSWLLQRQESTQDLSGFFMARPTSAWSVSTPVVELGTPSDAPLPATMPSFSRDGVLAPAEAQFGSPGLLQTSLASGGESPAAAGLQQPGASQSLEIAPTATLVGPAVAANARPLPVGEEVSQSTSPDISTIPCRRSHYECCTGDNRSRPGGHRPPRV